MKIIESTDRRLLMCGHIIIKLNSTLDEIDDIGVIEVDKIHH